MPNSPPSNQVETSAPAATAVGTSSVGLTDVIPPPGVPAMLNPALLGSDEVGAATSTHTMMSTSEYVSRRRASAAGAGRTSAVTWGASPVVPASHSSANSASPGHAMLFAPSPQVAPRRDAALRSLAASCRPGGGPSRGGDAASPGGAAGPAESALQQEVRRICSDSRSSLLHMQAADGSPPLHGVALGPSSLPLEDSNFSPIQATLARAASASSLLSTATPQKRYTVSELSPAAIAAGVETSHDTTLLSATAGTLFTDNSGSHSLPASSVCREAASAFRRRNSSRLKQNVVVAHREHLARVSPAAERGDALSETSRGATPSGGVVTPPSAGRGMGSFVHFQRSPLPAPGAPVVSSMLMAGAPRPEAASTSPSPLTPAVMKMTFAPGRAPAASTSHHGATATAWTSSSSSHADDEEEATTQS